MRGDHAASSAGRARHAQDLPRDGRGRARRWPIGRPEAGQYDDRRLSEHDLWQAGRDEEIDKVRQSIREAGRAGLPVIEYNFYAHRIVEGYYEETGRAGAALTAFDYDRVKDLPPLPEEGVYSIEEMWANIVYFLKTVVPVAEEAGVRLASSERSSGAAQPGGRADHGDARGMEAADRHCSEPRQQHHIRLRGDARDARGRGRGFRNFGERDRINHVHFRNVRVVSHARSTPKFSSMKA